MKVREERLPIRGFGVAPASADIAVQTLSPRERLRRSATPPAIGLGLAILVLPIPIVHFAVPPMAILAGLAIGIRRAFHREIIATARGHCPFCQAEQSLGLTGANYTLPRDLKCRSCGRLLTLDRAA